MAPPSPAGTIAAFETVEPVYEFIVDTFGGAIPLGQAMKTPSCGARGKAVKFNEYAPAPAGIPQVLAGIGKERCEVALIDGGPNGPANSATRVSAIRQGIVG